MMEMAVAGVDPYAGPVIRAIRCAIVGSVRRVVASHAVMTVVVGHRGPIGNYWSSVSVAAMPVARRGSAGQHRW